MTERQVSLSAATLDSITIMVLREWRKDIIGSTPVHSEDRAADAMRIAAIDVLLAYNSSAE